MVCRTRRSGCATRTRRGRESPPCVCATTLSWKRTAGSLSTGTSVLSFDAARVVRVVHDPDLAPQNWGLALKERDSCLCRRSRRANVRAAHRPSRPCRCDSNRAQRPRHRARASDRPGSRAQCHAVVWPAASMLSRHPISSKSAPCIADPIGGSRQSEYPPRRGGCNDCIASLTRAAAARHRTTSSPTVSL